MKSPKATIETLNEYLRLKQLVEKHEIEPSVLEEMAEQYDWLDEVFEENGKKGVRTITGEVIVPAMYDEYAEVYSTPLFHIDDGISPNYIALRGDKCGIVASDGIGKPLTDFCYDDISFLYDENCYATHIGEFNGLMSDTGDTIIPCEMDEIIFAWNGTGRYAFCKDNKWGMYSNETGYIAPTLEEAILDGEVVRKPEPDTCYIRKFVNSYHISLYEGVGNDGFYGDFYYLSDDGWYIEPASYGREKYYGEILGHHITKEQYIAIIGRVKKVTQSIYHYAETHIEKQASTANAVRCYLDSNVLYKQVNDDIKECLVIDPWSLSYCDYKCFTSNPQHDNPQPISEKTYEHCKKRILDFTRKKMELCKSIIDNSRK